MTANDNTGRQRAFELLAVGGRWFMGGLFVYMGCNKALHPEVFLKLVDQYQLVKAPLLLNSIAAALPWFEVICGLLLLAGVAVRGTAVLLIAMLVPFTLAVMARAISIAGAKGLALCAVKFDCGCGMGEVFACRKVVENCLLLLIAGWLLTGRGRAFALRFNLFRPGGWTTKAASASPLDLETCGMEQKETKVTKGS
jgi:uncharacterized membrane protein YphA (DoxX/SURF4 family)